MFRSRKKQKAISLEGELPLSEERQWEIINEEALSASAKLIHLQVELWNQTMTELAEVGVFVRVDDELFAEMNALISRLKAASLVAFDLLDINPAKAEQ